MFPLISCNTDPVNIVREESWTTWHLQLCRGWLYIHPVTILPVAWPCLTFACNRVIQCKHLRVTFKPVEVFGKTYIDFPVFSYSIEHFPGFIVDGLTDWPNRTIAEEETLKLNGPPLRVSPLEKRWKVKKSLIRTFAGCVWLFQCPVDGCSGPN